MQAIQVYIENGLLRLSPQTPLPPNARLAILVIAEDELPDYPDSRDITRLMELSGSLDFLHSEPDLYTDEDLLPDRRNPQFRATGT